MDLTEIYPKMWDSDKGYLSTIGGPWPKFEVRIRLSTEEQPIAGWTVFRTNGLVIISSAWVARHHQGKGLGKLLAAFRVAAFHEMKKLDCEDIEMICRSAPRNERQQHILREAGWTQLTDTLWSVK